MLSEHGWSIFVATVALANRRRICYRFRRAGEDVLGFDVRGIRHSADVEADSLTRPSSWAYGG